MRYSLLTGNNDIAIVKNINKLQLFPKPAAGSFSNSGGRYKLIGNNSHILNNMLGRELLEYITCTFTRYRDEMRRYNSHYYYGKTIFKLKEEVDAYFKMYFYTNGYYRGTQTFKLTTIEGEIRYGFSTPFSGQNVLPLNVFGTFSWIKSFQWETLFDIYIVEKGTEFTII